MPVRTIETQCVIVGGGPAGMMAGLLLARAGIDVTVLEKHADFLRDFRGDTVHPSTLRVLDDLGMLDEFLRRPHQEVRDLSVRIGGEAFKMVDFSGLPPPINRMVFMPQWDFLNFLAEKARTYPHFHLHMQANVTDLLTGPSGGIEGVAARTPDGPLQVRALLTLGADGRHSTVRSRTGLHVTDLGASIDVLWMRLTKRPSDPPGTLGNVEAGQFLVMIDRGDYWQCAYVIPKGAFDAVKAAGLDTFRDTLAAIAPLPRDRMNELDDWDHVKLLTVAVDRLGRWWKPGLLCIGNSAHAMSPVGGVGINLALQDAVAACNMLAGPLAAGVVPIAALRAVQRRRAFPAYAIQSMQTAIHKRVIGRVMAETQPIRPFWLVRLFDRSPFLRGIPARVLGIGLRPERVTIKPSVLS